MNPHVVVLGAPRSGTSIMGELFETLPQFNYYFEPGIEWLRRTPWSQFRWAMKNPVDLGGGDRDAAVTRRTAGVSVDLDELIDVVDGELTCVWIVRHPLDMAASAVPGLTDGWSHCPEPLNWRELLDVAPHVRAAHMWRWVNREGLESVTSRLPVEIVRYEDLVINTRETVVRILGHVGGVSGDDPGVEAYLSMVSAETGGYEAKHQVRWSTHDHESHVGRWRSSLSPSAVDEVLSITGDVARDFNYEVHHEG